MRFFPEEKFKPVAEPRHARLFELIRQDNLPRPTKRGFLKETAGLSAQERLREAAVQSLRPNP